MNHYLSLLLIIISLATINCVKVNKKQCKELFSIIENNQIAELKCFLQKNLFFNSGLMDVTNCVNNIGVNPFLLAVDGGPTEIIEMMIKACSNETLHSVDSDNYNAISTASTTNNGEVIALLLAAKISPLVICKSLGDSALIEASRKGNTKVVEELLKVLDVSFVNLQNNESSQKMTALMSASENQHIDVVEMLLSKGANLHLVDTSERSALDRAILLGLEKSMNYLTDYIISHPLDAFKAHSVITSIHYAKRKNRNDIAKKLNDYIESLKITYKFIPPPPQ